MNLIKLFQIRSENHRRSRHRVREEFAGCDNINDVFFVRVRAHGFADLYGCAHPEVYQEFSRRRLMGKPH